MAVGKVYVVFDRDALYANGKPAATVASYKVVAPLPEELEYMAAGERVTERMKNGRKSSDRKR